MIKSKGTIAGIVLVVIGLALALGPQYVFPPCEPAVNAAGHAAPMRCWWTARVEIGVGGALLLGGVLIALGVNVAFRTGVAAMTLALSVAAAAMPLGLIGVCGNESMHCRLAMSPALVILSAFAALASLIVVLHNRENAR